MKRKPDELTSMALIHLMDEVTRLQDQVGFLKNRLRTEKKLRWHALRFIQDAGLAMQFKFRRRANVIDPPESFMTGKELWTYPNHSPELNN